MDDYCGDRLIPNFLGGQMRDLKFRVYSKEYGMSEPCSIFDIQIMDMEGLTDMSQVKILEHTRLKDKTGKEAYAGDILDAPIGKGVIEFGQYGNVGDREAYHMGFYVKFECENADFYRKELGYWLPKSEIIGSVLSNPELLEVT
jgi:hypothetical protein